jgi:hypothetical protein
MTKKQRRKKKGKECPPDESELREYERSTDEEKGKW